MREKGIGGSEKEGNIARLEFQTHRFKNFPDFFQY